MDFRFTINSTAIMDRATSVEKVGGTSGAEEAVVEHAYWQMGLSQEYHDYLDGVVNADTALKYSAVWACVRWISQTISALGFHVYEKDGRARNQVELSDDTAWLLDMQANPETSAFEWRQVMLQHALTVGNGYSEIERDGFGRMRWVWQLGRDRVYPDRTLSGKLIYEVQNGSGMKNTVLMPEDVYHLKGPGPDGIVGYSIIEMARQTISLGLDEERFGQNFFGRGPTPGGILKIPTRLTETARKEHRKSFERLYGGKQNVGRVVVLDGGAEFTPLSLPNRDAQFLESRNFSVTEIARWYGVPPHKIADLTRSTNNNIEQQSIEAVQDCLLPWARRLESEADVKMFGRVNRGKRFTRLNLASLLRGDTASQTTALTAQVTSGIRQINEARELLDMNPVDGGDTSLVQGAMIPLERALNPPPAPAPPKPGKPAEPGTPNPEPDSVPAAIAATFGKLLRDAYAGLLNFEAERAKRAHNKNRLPAWVEEYYNIPSPAIAARIAPVIHALAVAMGSSADTVEIIALLADEHSGESYGDLVEHGVAAIERWSARAEQQAERHLLKAWSALRPTNSEPRGVLALAEPGANGK